MFLWLIKKFYKKEVFADFVLKPDEYGGYNVMKLNDKNTYNRIANCASEEIAKSFVKTYSTQQKRREELLSRPKIYLNDNGEQL